MIRLAGAARALRVLLRAVALAVVVGCGGASDEPPTAAAATPEIPLPAAGTVEPAVEAELAAAHRRLEVAHGRPPAERARALAEVGRLHAAYELWEGAEVALAAAARLAPEDADLHYLLGWVRDRRGDHEGAVEAFSRTLELAPADAVARLRRAEALLALDRAAEAERDLAAVLERGESPAAHFGLARAAARQGDDRRAAEHFERTLELAPEATEVHAPLAQALRRLGAMEDARYHAGLWGETPVPFPDRRVAALAAGAEGGALAKAAGDEAVLAGDLEAAAAAYRRAVAAAPEDFYARKSLGLTLAELGDAAGAARELRAALELGPPGGLDAAPREALEIHFTLGALAANQGDAAAARGHLEAALAADPGHAPAHLALGDLAGRAGRLADALAHYGRALAADPGLAAARRQRATTLMDLGRFAEAVPDLEHLARTEPDDRRIAELLATARERGG